MIGKQMHVLKLFCRLAATQTITLINIRLTEKMKDSGNFVQKTPSCKSPTAFVNSPLKQLFRFRQARFRNLGSINNTRIISFTQFLHIVRCTLMSPVLSSIPKISLCPCHKQTFLYLANRFHVVVRPCSK